MNNSSETSDQSVVTDYRPNIQIIIWMASGIWTMGANGLILYCFVKNRRRQWTGFSSQVCSMTAGDFLSGLFLTQYLTMYYYPVPTCVCSLSIYLLLSTQCVSFFHVLGICIFRNSKMKNLTINDNPFQNLRISICIISAAWILSFLVMLLPIILWAEFSDSVNTCSPRTIFDLHHSDVMIYIASFYSVSQFLTNAIYFVAVYRLRTKIRQIIPTSTIQITLQLQTTSRQSTGPGIPNQTSKATTSSFISNSGISHQTAQAPLSSHARRGTSKASGRFNSGITKSQPALSILKNYKHVLVTTGFVLLVYDIFTLPFTISFFATFNSPTVGPVRFIGIILLSVNSSINPIVYASRITSIRLAIKQLLHDCMKACHGEG